MGVLVFNGYEPFEYLSSILVLLNSGGGDIKFGTEPRWGFNGVVLVGNGKIVGERSGDFGDFNIVAYNEPSNGPWVCCEDAEK